MDNTRPNPNQHCQEITGPRQTASPTPHPTSTKHTRIHGIEHAAQQRDIWIFTANQAVIKRLSTLKPGHRHHLLHISTELNTLTCSITVQRVPGHTYVVGNEKADELVELATTQKPPSFSAHHYPTSNE